MIVSGILTCLCLFQHFGQHQTATVKVVRRGKERLNGVELRLSAFHYPPLMTITRRPDGNFTYGGLYMGPLELLSQIFNVTFKFIHIDQTNAQGNNVADVLKQQLLRQEVDISGYFFEITLESTKYMELSFPVHTAAYTLLQPWPKEESRLAAPIRPFDLTVWLLFLASAAAFIVFLALMSIMEKKTTGLSIMFRDTLRSGTLWGLIYSQFEYVLTIISSQGNYIRYTTSAFLRISIMIWLLPMTVLVFAYTGTLTASLMAPKLEPIVSNLGELAASSKFRLTVEKSLLMADIIFNGKEEYYEVFREKFREDPSLLNGDPLMILNNVLNHQCVYAGTTDICNLFMREDFKGSGTCRMLIPPVPLDFFISYQTGFPKGSPYVGIVDQYYNLPAKDNGFIHRFTKDYFPPQKQCRLDAASGDGAKVITLAHLSAPFFILAVGLTAATIVFILENLAYRLFKHHD